MNQENDNHYVVDRRQGIDLPLGIWCIGRTSILFVATFIPECRDEAPGQESEVVGDNWYDTSGECLSAVV